VHTLQSLRKEAEDYLAKFGVPASVLSRWEFKKVASSIWLVSKDLKQNEAFNIQTSGLRLLHITKLGFKPTSYALQFLAPYISARVCDVNKEELLSILKGNAVEKETESGYVAIRYKGLILGCGLVRDNMLYSQFPKVIRNILLELLKDSQEDY
jgi:NOL1/NOP2/fmu family ribosome biogenesis protein